MKTIPAPNSKKTVALGDIVIFFNAKVGILLTNKIAIRTVRYGVSCLISIPRFKFVSSYIKGIKTNSPPAGDGIPSKKLFFQPAFSSILVKLNLANLKTQQTE